jgi:HEAT repeat protein
MGARVLAMFGDAGTPALRELARDPREGVRSYVIAELGARRDAPSIPAMRDALGDRSWRVRETAIAALHRIREPAAVALPDLCRIAVGDERVTVRMQALVSLVPIGKGDPRVVAALAEALRDPTVQIRHAAASELASLGPAALAAEAALDAATHDADESVSLAAAAALKAVKKK